MDHSIHNKQSPQFFIDGVLRGDVAVLSRAITLTESTSEDHKKLARQVLEGIIDKTGNSFRLGITGVPGVGKSTFIESFGKEIITRGHKLAVLAVDPSSNKSKGSILGDKTRMEELSVMENVYVRPSPSSGTLGGVARASYETILLCEAAGFDFIIIETVGVGQSEVTVSKITDFFLLLMLAGAGDELQGIKRGIMEMADSVVITKADGNNIQKARAAKMQYESAMHLLQPLESGFTPKVETCSSLENKGITEVLDIIENYRRHVTANNFFLHKRKQQQRELLFNFLEEKLKEKFYTHPSVIKSIKELEEKSSEKGFISFGLANDLIENVFKNLH
ncbi:MAG: methylmalonyl Co-A mutase-associated GTPase MeaB [Bacteroidetes bacterium]|nr:methylmalonyl Co-A mutase-associated GTPase MeaB [Bacteroidota bacterium]